MYGKELYLVVGGSGSGKDSLVDELNRVYGYRKLVSVTTRKPRVGEKNGREHWFTSNEEYSKMKLCVSSEYGENGYGAREEDIENSDIYIIDYNGILEAKRNIYSKKLVVIYIKASESIRKERMFMRGDSEYNIERRIKQDREMISLIERSRIYDYCYCNVGSIGEWVEWWKINIECNSNIKVS